MQAWELGNRGYIENNIKMTAICECVLIKPELLVTHILSLVKHFVSYKQSETWYTVIDQ